jgi:hypothetical protein
MTAELRKCLLENSAPHGIPGLPDDLRLTPRALQTLRSSGHRLEGHTTPSSKTNSWSRDRHEVIQHPIETGPAQSFVPREGRPHRIEYHDPALSDLIYQDDGDPIINHTYAKAKPHLAVEIVPLDEPNIMYRGMDAAEYQSFRETGSIRSHGKMNFKTQEGLTYWATDPATAASYANSFAHPQNKPTFTRPAYVVAAHRPTHTVHIPGTGENEIGVPTAIFAEDVIAVWQGDVYSLRPGSIDLSRNYDDEWDLGGGSSPNAHVVWKKIL